MASLGRPLLTYFFLFYFSRRLQQFRVRNRRDGSDDNHEHLDFKKNVSLLAERDYVVDFFDFDFPVTFVCSCSVPVGLGGPLPSLAVRL